MAKCCSWVVERYFGLELVARTIRDSGSLRDWAADLAECQRWSFRAFVLYSLWCPLYV